MAVVSSAALLQAARKGRYAVGSFIIWGFDSAFAVAKAAQKYGQPVMMMIGSRDAEEYLGGYDNVRSLVNCVAKTVDVPIALHADHFNSYESIVRAIQGGFTSVMIDASKYPLEENIRMVKEVVKVAHAANVSVEAELGRLPGNEGDEDVSLSEAFQTNPDEAAYFVEQTGIDALAVAIGTMHGAYPAGMTPVLNIGLVEKLRERVPVPLVMHGGSGTPEDKFRAAIQAGISKVNIATDLVTATAKKLAEIQQQPIRYNVEGTFYLGRAACQEAVEEKIRLFAGL